MSSVGEWLSESRALANEYSQLERKVKTSDTIESVMKVSHCYFSYCTVLLVHISIYGIERMERMA